MAPWGGDPVDAMAELAINASKSAQKEPDAGLTSAVVEHEDGEPSERKNKETPQQHGWPMPKQLDYSLINASVKKQVEAGVVFASSKTKYDPNVFPAQDGDYVVDKAMEDALFAKATRTQAGGKIGIYGEYKIHIQAKKNLEIIISFDDERIDPAVRQNIGKLGYNHPLPIQMYAMPHIFAGSDILAVAQTGSGKTAAYLVPILSLLLANNGKLIKEKPNPATFDPRVDYYESEPSTIVLVPTRELAIQIGDQVAALAYRTKVRYCLAYGGAPRNLQIEDIRRGCDVLIGTPGRIKDIVHNAADKLSLRRLRYIVLDEADELVQDDWKDDINGILSVSSADETGTYLMFSATFAPESRELARKYLSDDRMTMCIGRYGSTTHNIHQVIVWTDQHLKKAAVYDLLNGLPVARTMIFCNSKRMVDEVDDFLHGKGMPCNVIHGDRTQREREMAIDDFKNMEAPIIITTGVAARGLDLPDVRHVINFDLPSIDHGGIVEYTHRIGRTARIGNLGQATSFYNERDEAMATELAKILLENKHELPDFLKEFAPPATEPLYADEDLKEEDAFEIGENDGKPEGGQDNDPGWGEPAGESAGEPAAEAGTAGKTLPNDVWPEPPGSYGYNSSW